METLGTIVLIQPHCSFRLKGPNALLTKYDAIGLLALRACLEKHGYPVKVVHVSRALDSGYTVKQILSKIMSYAPILAGISMNWLHMSAGALEMAELIKINLPDVPVVLGGSHASLFAGEIVRDYPDTIDGVVVGEGEECLLEIAGLVNSGKTLEGIDGLMIRRGNKIIYHKREAKTTLDDLSFYSYKDIWPRTQDLEALSLAALNTTRGGCAKSCNYCLESHSCIEPQRAAASHFSAEHLLEQIKIFQSQGKSYITIQDQLTCHGDRLLTELVEGMNTRGIKLDHLSLFIEPGCLSRDVYDCLETAPVKELVLSFGIETGSEKVSRNMGRVIDYQKLYEELEYIGRKRFYANTWWMLGLPGEEEADLQKTMGMMQETIKMGVGAHSVSPMILFPKTKLSEKTQDFQMVRTFIHFEDFKQFSYTERNDDAVYPELITHSMPYQPKKMTIRYLETIKKKVYEWEGANSALINKQQELLTNYTRFRKAEIF